MSTPSRKLQQDLQDLSQYYDLWIDDWYRFVIIRGMNLPPGYNYATTDVLLELPSDYPVSPPGQGKYSVMINVNLRFRGRLPAEYREHRTPEFPTPGFGPWAWICYQQINWDPFYDNLIGFVEMLRADLTNPPTV